MVCLLDAYRGADAGHIDVPAWTVSGLSGDVDKFVKRCTEWPSDVLYHAHLYLKSTSTPTIAAAALIPLSRVPPDVIGVPPDVITDCTC